MLSPTPLSLLCALLLCLPLAVIFTITSPTTTATTTASTTKNYQKLKIKTIISLPRPPRPPPPQDDESLFRLAAGINPRPVRRKKIAFLFLTTTPLHFAPLWELYFDQAPKQLFNIYIHADPSYKYDPPFSGMFANRVIHSEPAKRFTPTLASAARRLLAHALVHDPSNAMFALLSPSCIPLHSFNFTYKTLARSKKSFIEILRNESWAYDRWAARGPDAMLPEVKLEDFRIGSQFWVLSREHARVVVGDQMIWAKFNKTCVVEDACYPEENYFPTLIHMKDPRGSVSATLTHVDWRDSFDGHPRMYEASDVGSDLIVALRNSRPRYGDDEGRNGSDSSVRRRHDPFLFARKFSPDSIQPLMSIAKEAILKD
ncbi:hypothetical protein JCGZ_07158 [Jatropha curcas]|uniref:Core-2/I-branching beta-1,6-N-acetylglucosaminyltransferase family protein n=1 Tax=Jatropha curcas TaxID=180498 RepID=A0A067KBR1_JATCU|nr:glycosyltransferase BC10 [Jatropha curcas]KDP33587.1 hypothetical protein JCGZ_07158 [Jatropha curcas]